MRRFYKKFLTFIYCSSIHCLYAEPWLLSPWIPSRFEQLTTTMRYPIIDTEKNPQDFCKKEYLDCNQIAERIEQLQYPRNKQIHLFFAPYKPEYSPDKRLEIYQNKINFFDKFYSPLLYSACCCQAILFLADSRRINLSHHHLEKLTTINKILSLTTGANVLYIMSLNLAHLRLTNNIKKAKAGDQKVAFDINHQCIGWRIEPKLVSMRVTP